jgi:hypothetical protein
MAEGKAAKRRGVAFGRPQKLRPDQRTFALSLVQEGGSIREVARTFNVHPAKCATSAKSNTVPFRRMGQVAAAHSSEIVPSQPEREKNAGVPTFLPLLQALASALRM